MEEKKRRVLITGSRGYLAGQVIDRLRNDPNVEVILGVDTKYAETCSVETLGQKAPVVHWRLSIADPSLFNYLIDYKIDSILHLGWWFNPTHRVAEQWKINVDGTNNVIRACQESKTVKYLFYGGSSTAYGQLDGPNEESLAEEDWQKNSLARLNTAYPYAKQKAQVDLNFQALQQDMKNSMPDFQVGWMRGAIVAGRNTRNVVVDVAEAFGPIMFRARGCNPLMQFISEYDMTEVLYRAVMQRWIGPVNVAGTGTIRYSKIIELLGKKEVVLPFWLLYAFCWLGWNIRIRENSLLKFPPSILHLVSKPWVGNIKRLISEFGYEPQNSSIDAILELKAGLDKRCGGS